MDVTEQQRYLIVTTDSHAGPSLEGQLRPYCPSKYLDDFDAYATSVRSVFSGGDAEDADVVALKSRGFRTRQTPGMKIALDRCKRCAGQQDPEARLRDLDADGVAAEVIYAGGFNDEPLPFVGVGFDAGPKGGSAELRAVGDHIWNEWLADFVAVQPERRAGVMQIPIWDVDAAVAEVRWAAGRGLRAVNFPAPRSDFPAYNDPVYDPLWSVCCELGVPLVTHSSGGERPLGVDGPAGSLIHQAEVHWMSRRALWQMIFGGVFERFADLKLVFTEQRVSWAPETLHELDSLHQAQMMIEPEKPPRLPSDYWATNCFIAGSFMAPFEVAARHEIGVRNLMWGSDYPHPEGTWPHTQQALRHAFAGVREDDVRAILGENAVEVFGFDRDALRAVADRIGPTPADVSVPLLEEEYPEFRGYAFRTYGNFS